MTLLPFPIYFSINRQQLLCFEDENPRKHTVYFRNCLVREDAIYWAIPILLTVKVTVMSSEVLNNVHTETVSRSWRKTVRDILKDCPTNKDKGTTVLAPLWTKPMPMLSCVLQHGSVLWNKCHRICAAEGVTCL